MGFNKQNITLHGLHVYDDARFSVGFLAVAARNFPVGSFFLNKRRQSKFFFPSKLQLNLFKIVVISLPSHRNCTTHFRTDAKPLILHETKLQLFYTEISFSFQSLKIYGNLDRLVLGTFLFAHSLHAGFHSGRTKEPLAGPGAFKQSGHFLSCRIFSKAQKLLVCHKLVKCYSNLQGKFQLTNKTAPLRNTHLRPFRPDQGPHSVPRSRQ